MAGNLLEYLASEPWQDDAQCIGTANEVFFPNDRGVAVRSMERIAKSICQECIVRAECLDFALRTRQSEGIWGGKTAAQRRSIIRRAS